MTAVLSDAAARRRALTDLTSTMLVQAGAGSGKTSLMGGRVVALLASGVRPKHIAAVSFTEKAASELLERILRLMEEALSGSIGHDLRPGFPDGLTPVQLSNLEAARAELNELNCTTIHGFAQRLIKPYPVEANIDPGAALLDPVDAGLLFDDLFDGWIRQKLGGEDGGVIADLVAFEPDQVVATLREIAGKLKDHRHAHVAQVSLGSDPCGAFQGAAAQFKAFLDGAGCHEPESHAIHDGFEEMLVDMGKLTGKSEIEAAIGVIRHDVWPEAVFTKSGGFKAYNKKGKWQGVATSKAEGERLSIEGKELYQACAEGFEAVRQAAAACLLGPLVDEVRPLVADYQAAKRNAAALDFDDLIHAARDMLAGHDQIRLALADRYRAILVDEYQDTDPVQTEVFTRLAGEPPAGRPDAPLEEWGWRPGGLFLVGDPQQAIYRFRGADVTSYVAARERMKALSLDSIITIGVNFRSVRSILEWVNERFLEPLGAAGQPGFSRLDHFHDDHGRGPAVASLPIQMPEGKAEDVRDAEAAAVSDFCSRIVGRYIVSDRKTGEPRLCAPGDIALLAPMGTDLWRYEAALEEIGLSVATQAGKGLFRRQEVQDLIALARVLVDGRDSLALGALLRGPLVGLTDEELLDIADALPREEGRGLPFLRRDTDPEHVAHPLANRVLRKLQSLASIARRTTPYEALSQAVDELEVRAIIRARYTGDPERALANVDRFIDMSAPYAVRGMRAFADAMKAAWADNNRVAEGRPDGEEQSVSIITMHSAKGLQWPVVIPVNTRSQFMPPPQLIFEVTSGRMSRKLFSVTPAGHDEVAAVFEANVAAERVRLWYVATTRAEDLLLIPHFSEPAKSNQWGSVLELALDALPAFPIEDYDPQRYDHLAGADNTQTKEIFAADTMLIRERKTVSWITPSKHDEMPRTAMVVEEDEGLRVDEEDERPIVQGSRRRGVILHKLMEEVLGGELADDGEALKARAGDLAGQLLPRGMTLEEAALDQSELAASVARTLALPEVSSIRSRLFPEAPVAASFENGEISATYGVADAVAVTEAGAIDIVLDWKSDVDPDTRVINGYRAQVADYLRTVGAKHGMIVFMTSGKVVEIISPT
jgi:ATP-dependent exoDNAse (exonuclease V) beta subunit